jgi:hypothetical protein
VSWSIENAPWKGSPAQKQKLRADFYTTAGPITGSLKGLSPAGLEDKRAFKRGFWGYLGVILKKNLPSVET